MVMGQTLQVTIWQTNQQADDSGGGAVLTGTVTYQHVPAGIFARRPTQSSFEQGLEVDAVYDMTLTLACVSLQENDEVEVTKPLGHPFYGWFFRVAGVQPGRRPVRFAHQHVTLQRVRKSRRNQRGG